MQIRKGKQPGSGRLGQVGVVLSREARVRLAWMASAARRCIAGNAVYVDFYRGCDTWPIPAVTSDPSMSPFQGQGQRSAGGGGIVCVSGRRWP